MVKIRTLTARQIEILIGKRDLLLSKEIATKLGISERAVEKNLAKIREALGVSTVRDALRAAYEYGLLDSGNPTFGLPDLPPCPTSVATPSSSERLSPPDAVLREDAPPFDYRLEQTPEGPVRKGDSDAIDQLKIGVLIVAIAAGVVFLLANYSKIIDLAQDVSRAILNR